jgi:hypothetical protein
MYHELLWYVKLFVKVWFFYFYFLNSLSFNFWRKIIMRTNCFQNFENCKKFSMSQLLSYLYIQKMLFYIFLDVTFLLEPFLTDYLISTMEPPWTYYLFFAKICIWFGFWKRLFQLISYITETEQKVNDKKLVWIGPLLNLSLNRCAQFDLLRTLSDESFSKSKLYKNFG